MNIKELNLPIVDIIQEAPDVKTFLFNTKLNYKPGQFAMIFLDDQKKTNAYSFASSPTESNQLKFTIKINPEGGKLSPGLDKLQINDSLNIKGPYGMFVYDNPTEEEIIFIAGGTGLAPFRSMIKYIIDNNINKKLTLLFSVRTPNYILYKKELDEWKNNNKIEIVYSVTRLNEYNGEWKGETGRIDKEFLDKYVKNKESLIYICGPPLMVDGVISSLQELGISKGKLKYEKWG